MRVVTIVGALLALTIPAAAAAGNPEAALRRCATLDTDPERLACFDNVVAGLISDDSNWRVTDKSDPLTNQIVVTITNHGISTGRGPVFFSLRCRAGQTEAWVSINEYLGNGSKDGGHSVSYRIGDEIIYEDVYWPLSTDKKAVFFAGKMNWLLRNLVTSDRLVLRTTPYNENPVTATFDLAGLQAVLDRIGDKCKWEQ